MGAAWTSVSLDFENFEQVSECAIVKPVTQSSSRSSHLCRARLGVAYPGVFSAPAVEYVLSFPMLPSGA
eukprot:scaffold92108_cov30-Tisochrysis_lutea.AAC.3